MRNQPSQPSSDPTEPEGPEEQGAQAVQRLIVREGAITLTVEDTQASRETIEQWVAEMADEGAFVVSSSESGTWISMVIRVPATGFHSVMDQLASLAVEVDDRSESAQDVTEEYVDVAARAEALEVARARLLTIMEEASSAEELLGIEEQLTRREAEIESLRARMLYLEEAARLSKIEIDLRPYRPSQPIDDEGWRLPETVRLSLEHLLGSIRVAVTGMIYFVIVILPWLLLLSLLYSAGRWVRRRLQR